MHVDAETYFQNVKQWRAELEELRRILLAAGLTEDFKWRSPCYTYQGKNVVILGELKNACTLGFFKGALLKDPRGILAKPGENTRSARLLRFTEVREILKLESTLKAYLREAIENEAAGRKVDLEQDRALELPEELQAKFDESPELEQAFSALTPGRQRAYLLHFAAAKQAKTRIARIEKFRPRILDGKGPNDCVCGLSKKMPNCDGSHKQLA
ncbi:MAG: DUF1801 domain-containing protein [Blastopirellula sp. JB062]